MAQTPEQVILGYNTADHLLRTQLRTYVEGMWLSAGSWRDSDVNRIMNRVIPQVQGSQLRMAALTSAYVQAQAALEGRTIRAVPVARVEVLTARGVDPDIVYHRPAVTMYTALSKGTSVSDAIKQGATRLTSLALTDITLAKTHQERASYSESGYEYTVRTLTGRENCAMCLIASTQRYHAKDLRPIHPGCDCGSKQVSAGHDPGQVLDPNFLEQVHAAVDAEFGSSDRGGRNPDYRKMIAVREHGELGPVLTWKSQHFTGPADL